MIALLIITIAEIKAIMLQKLPTKLEFVWWITFATVYVILVNVLHALNVHTWITFTVGIVYLLFAIEALDAIQKFETAKREVAQLTQNLEETFEENNG